MAFTRKQAQWHVDNGTWVKPKWWHVLTKWILGAGDQASTIFNPITGFKVVGRAVEVVQERSTWSVRVVWSQGKDTGRWFGSSTTPLKSLALRPTQRVRLSDAWRLYRSEQ